MMFYGPKPTTDPKVIYSGEYGIDQRFAADAMYGRGLAFADNSKYTSKYAYQIPNVTAETGNRQ